MITHLVKNKLHHGAINPSILLKTKETTTNKEIEKGVENEELLDYDINH